MAYGHDYKEALQGFILLPVKFFTSAFGYWWSRYWNYLDDELRNLVTGCF